jgi:hypothetical protein
MEYKNAMEGYRLQSQADSILRSAGYDARGRESYGDAKTLREAADYAIDAGLIELLPRPDLDLDLSA